MRNYYINNVLLYIIKLLFIKQVVVKIMLVINVQLAIGRLGRGVCGGSDLVADETVNLGHLREYSPFRSTFSPYFFGLNFQFYTKTLINAINHLSCFC